MVRKVWASLEKGAGRQCKTGLLKSGRLLRGKQGNYHYSQITNSSNSSSLKKQKTDHIMPSAVAALLAVRDPGLSLNKMT